MKTHYAEENDDVISSNDTADDHCWREHQVKKSQIIGETVLVVSVIGAVVFAGALLSSQNPDPQDVAAQSRPARANPPPQYANRPSSPHVLKADASDDR